MPNGDLLIRGFGATGLQHFSDALSPSTLGGRLMALIPSGDKGVDLLGLDIGLVWDQAQDSNGNVLIMGTVDVYIVGLNFPDPPPVSIGNFGFTPGFPSGQTSVNLPGGVYWAWSGFVYSPGYFAPNAAPTAPAVATYGAVGSPQNSFRFPPGIVRAINGEKIFVNFGQATNIGNFGSYPQTARYYAGLSVIGIDYGVTREDTSRERSLPKFD